jgi:hypothetical protein
MSLSENDSDQVGAELGRIKELIADADGHHRINAWEEEFLASLAEKITEWGERTYISERQWAVIERIEEKLAAY